MAEGYSETLQEAVRRATAERDSNGIGSYCGGLWRASESASQDNRTDDAAILSALAGACSMMLAPGQSSIPFRPLAQSVSGRSAMPEDFDASALAAFRFFASITADVDLRARLFDVIWLRERDAQMARQAVESYLLTAESNRLKYYHTRTERLSRAVELTMQLRLPEKDINAVVRRSLAVMKYNEGENKQGHALALLEFLSKSGAMKVEELLAAVAEVVGPVNEIQSFEVRRSVLLFQAKLLYQTKNAENAKASILAAADTLLAEANSATVALVERHFVERAVHTLRGIRNYRVHPDVVQKIDTLKSRLMALRDSALDQMQEISGPAIPIGELVEHAVGAVAGKSAKEAILGIARLVEHPNRQSIRKGAENILQQSVLGRLFPSQRLGSDGRTVAKEFGGTLDAINDTELFNQMCQHASIHRRIVVAGSILPALETVMREHHLAESDFTWMFDANSMVPHGHEGILLRSILAGCRGDFLVAVSLLLPQIEHLLRFQLKCARHRDDGIRSERNRGSGAAGGPHRSRGTAQGGRRIHRV